MLTRPSTYRLVSWPTRIVICIIALGAAWLVVETWAAGIRLSKLMTALGERNAAAEAAALRAKQKPVEAPGEPGIIYLKMPPQAAAPPPRQP